MADIIDADTGEGGRDNAYDTYARLTGEYVGALENAMGLTSEALRETIISLGINRAAPGTPDSFAGTPSFFQGRKELADLSEPDSTTDFIKRILLPIISEQFPEDEGKSPFTKLELQRCFNPGSIQNRGSSFRARAEAFLGTLNGIKEGEKNKLKSLYLLFSLKQFFRDQSIGVLEKGVSNLNEGKEVFMDKSAAKAKEKLQRVFLGNPRTNGITDIPIQYALGKYARTVDMIKEVLATFPEDKRKQVFDAMGVYTFLKGSDTPGELNEVRQSMVENMVKGDYEGAKLLGNEYDSKK